MRPTAEQLYPLAVLAVLAGASLWLDYSTRTQDSASGVRPLGDPDFVAEQVRLVSFDAQGQAEYTLTARQVTHYPDQALSILLQPELHMLESGPQAPDAAQAPTGQPQVRIQASVGRAYEQDERIELDGHVLVRRDTADDAPPMTLETTTLTVWPAAQRAYSPAPVRLEQGRSLATGDGLRADNLFGTFELIGNTRVTIN